MMKQFIVLCVFVVLLPNIMAQSSHIDISLASDGLVSEHFSLSIMSNTTFTTFEFATSTLPISVEYDGEYTIIKDLEVYRIIFEKDLHVGENVVEFTVLYDNMVEKAGHLKMFRTQFEDQTLSNLSVSLTLPARHILSGSPSVTPRPKNIISDGQRLTLLWHFNEQSPSIIVFFEGEEKTSLTFIVSVAFGLVLIVASGFVLHKKKLKKVVENTLSQDELAILDQLRRGVSTQKNIAKNLQFSKSKMSKVLRKLEEKELISKEPHFKTNIIKIKKIK